MRNKAINNKTVPFISKLPKNLHLELKFQSLALGTTMNDVVIDAIRAYLSAFQNAAITEA